MRTLVAIVLLMVSVPLISLSAQGVSDNGKGMTDPAPTPHLRLDSGYLDIGIVSHDSIAEGVMHFRNTGNAPLQILRVFSDCGCTVPSYSKDDVMPGDTGVIKVRFNGKNRHPGSFRKILRIRSNADNPRETLIVKGRVSGDSED